MRRMANHGNGIALIFARTETDTFFETVWEKAQAILFLKGRLNFYRINGSPGLINSGAPSVLIAYGDDNAEVLRTCGLSGKWLAL
jgi:DNA N-6-adenine-methyltransferase (Dam).